MNNRPATYASALRNTLTLAQAHPYTAANLVVTPRDVMARLHQLADHLQADEIGITCWTHSPLDRMRSFELLAVAHGW